MCKNLAMLKTSTMGRWCLNLTILLLCGFLPATHTMECVMRGTDLDCSRKNLSAMPLFNTPRLESLDVSHNLITNLTIRSFHGMTGLNEINLSHNKISKLEINCFNELNNLKVLDLSHNQLSMPSSFNPGVFEPLKKLEVLYLQGTINSVAYPDAALGDLTNLKELYIQGVPQAFGPGFTNLTKLEVLHFSPPYCRFGALRNNTLKMLRFSPVKELVFQRCYITVIEIGSLRHLPVLKALNLVCNYALGIANVLRAVSNMERDTIETLVLDEIDRGIGDFKNFNKDTVCTHDFPNLKRISIRNNAVDSFSMNVLKCMPSLEVINLGFNALTVTWFPSHIFHPNTRKYWFESNITEMDFSHGFASFQPIFREKYCPEHLLRNERYFRKAVIPDPDMPVMKTSLPVDPPTPLALAFEFNPKLQALYFDHSLTDLSGETLRVYLSSSFCKIKSLTNSVRYLDASHNGFHNFNCSVLGLNNLQVVDLSHTNMKTITEDTISGAPSLMVLNLTGNQFALSAEQWRARLRHIPLLIYFSLSDNKLKQFHGDPFRNNKNIKTLDFSSNSLQTFHLIIERMHQLERLDLSHNLLTSLNGGFLQELKKRESLNHTLEINLWGNPFQCDCNTIDFLNFLSVASDYNVIFQRSDEYSCNYNENETRLSDVDIKILTDSCNVFNIYFIIIAVLAVVIVLVIIIAVLVYRCRWKIAWKVYEMRRVLRQAKRRSSFRLPVHKYKVFVAYATTDDDGVFWMRRELLPHVEDEWGMKAFILDRDSLVGPFLEEVTNGIRQSEMNLFVITPNFLRLYQWPIVLHWCVDSGLSTLILVLMDVKVRNLPPSLAKVAMALEKRYPHVFYLKSGTDNQEVWSNLKVALEGPKSKNTEVTVL